MMKNNAYICFLLVIAMAFSFVAIPSLDTSAVQSMTAADSGRIDVYDTAEYLTDYCSVLKYVDEESFLSNRFVKRIEDEESLNSYVFEKEDGTRSLYFFGEDVKFIDKDGRVLEKDVSLCESSEGFITKQNNVGLFLGDDLSKGVSVSFENTSLSLFPISNEKGFRATINNNTVVYPEAFGKSTDLIFTPLLSGVKQDIVLSKYEGINSFSFAVVSDELLPFSENGSLFFAESEDAEFRFVVGEVFIYDDAGHFVIGDIGYSSEGKNRWLITLSVPVDFLISEETVYPVVVDPTFYVPSALSSSYIADTTIYSQDADFAGGSLTYGQTGFVSNVFGEGRMLVSIPGLTANQTYNGILYTQINSAKFYVKELSGTAAQQVDLYKYTGTSWSENTATWNNTDPDGNYTLIDTQYTSVFTFTEYNITSLVRDWKLNPSDLSLGFMLKNTDDTDPTKCKSFASSEYSTLETRPFVEINYTPQIILENTISVNEGETYALNAFLLPPGQTLTWTSQNPSVATVDSSGVVTAVKADAYPAVITASVNINNVEYSASCWVYVKIPDGTYLLKNKGTEKYTDASGYSNESEVKRWSFHGGNNQRWEIEYLSGGLYSIKNVMSNKYLGVEGVNSTTAITRQYTSLNESTAKWYISKTASGAYIFHAKGNLSYGYVIGADPNSNNTIVNMSYTSDSNYSDEWVPLCISNNSVCIDVIYDQGYIDRFADYSQRINDSLLKLQKKFINEFGIWIEKNSITSFYSYADTDCSTAYNAVCTHSTDAGCSNSSFSLLKPYHHMNLRNMACRIELPTDIHYAKIAYLGHDYCYVYGGVHKNNPFHGVAYISERMSVITNHSTPQNEAKTTAHEFGHLFYAPDHYGGSAESTDDIITRTGDPGFSSDCIYGENRNNTNIVNSLIICDGCKNIIMSHAGDYN